MRRKHYIAVGVALGGIAALTAVFDPSEPSSLLNGTCSSRACREERAIAMGLLLNTPVSEETLAVSIEIADGLRQRYGLDSDRVHADRVTAAKRASSELFDRLAPSVAELRGTAAALGYGLDPETCGNTCANVERLARLEIQRRVLEKAVSPVPEARN